MSRSHRAEHPLLQNSRVDLAACLLLLVATAAVFLLVWFPTSRAWIQRIDNRMLEEVVDRRSSWLTAIARVFDVLGHVWVVWPIRGVVLVFLAVRRRWWHATAFAIAVALSEIAIGTLKTLYDRPRPPAALALVHTSGASFPSGHAVAASVTVVALVIALFPPGGSHRAGWGVAAAVFAFLMALSRVYLAVHWLSDVVAGTLLGIMLAVCTAYAVQAERIRRHRRHQAVGPPPSPAIAPE